MGLELSDEEGGEDAEDSGNGRGRGKGRGRGRPSTPTTGSGRRVPPVEKAPSASERPC